MRTRKPDAAAMIGYASLLLSAVLLAGTVNAQAGPELERGFLQPPDSAKPWVYWFWLNGNITREGITADLEAMKRVGIGGVLIMEVDQGAPVGPVDFMSKQWRDLFKHVVAEAQRLGLEVNMNNDAGWEGSGGPWIKPEQSMQKVVWTETSAEGSKQFDGTLPQPQATADFYRDIAVLAFPEVGPFRIDQIKFKAGYEVVSAGSAAPQTYSSEMAIDRQRMVDLTSRMDKSGHLSWEVPPGKWMVLRFGYTSTGAQNAPAPASGRGWECDKLSTEGIEANFAGMMGKLVADVGAAAGKTLVTTHIDSWENGSQNWTARMREEFQKRRGYDLLPFLPVMTGRVVGSLDISERFLWDLRQTISELIVENYAGRMRTLANQHGVKLSIEAYGGPTDDLPYAGRADEPMCEFWVGGGALPTCKEMASAAHIYGRPILGAESFTAANREKWLEHPASIKALGDRAFCDGVNRFVFHRYAMQPWLDRRPGMTMGPWGIHYERTETWWDWSAPWHAYLARCQFLLRQGLFVADVCYLEPEAAPQGIPGHEPLAYDYDNCSAEVVLTRMEVKDGRLVLPDGMSYRLMVLSRVQNMTPRLLHKVKELVQAGATIVGARPLRSPSLSDFPNCDNEVRTLADELWGEGKPSAGITEHSYGKGRVFGGARVEDKVEPAQKTENPLEHAKWIWHKEGNPAAAAPVGTRYFRRMVNIGADQSIQSARLVMTADNGFEAWVNGRPAGTGDTFIHIWGMDVTPLLKPGVNILAVAAENGADEPNPAGLIGSLTIRFSDGGVLKVDTDREWQTATTAPDKWMTEAVSAAAPAGAWGAAMELGPLGMAPWGMVSQAPPPTVFPRADVISEVITKIGVKPDFEADGKLRYVHRRDADTDIFFVANGEKEWVGTNCTFRVSGKIPEIWDPLTGKKRRQVIYREVDGRTTMPIWLEPGGSLFVVFRESSGSATSESAPVVAVSRDGRSALPEPGSPLAEAPVFELIGGQGGDLHLVAHQPGRYELKAADGKRIETSVAELPPPLEITGPWELSFAPNWGAPERVTLDKLISWSEHSDPGVKYFSGTATYRKTFSVPPEMIAKDRRLILDLGKVQVMAQVRLNDRDLGILWKPPFRVDVSDTLKPGENALEVKVVNLWPNRMIGDEQLPDDSDRIASGTLKAWPKWLPEGKPSPTGRYTFTSWRLWKKADPLLESGLLGPVMIRAAAVVGVRQ